MNRLKASAAVLALGHAGLACASGDSGTGAVGEMNLSGEQFFMLIGAVLAVGVLLWLVSKIASK